MIFFPIMQIKLSLITNLWLSLWLQRRWPLTLTPEKMAAGRLISLKNFQTWMCLTFLCKQSNNDVFSRWFNMGKDAWISSLASLDWCSCTRWEDSTQKVCYLFLRNTWNSCYVGQKSTTLWRKQRQIFNKLKMTKKSIIAADRGLEVHAW